MRAVFRSLAASTLLVIGYAIFIVIVVITVSYSRLLPDRVAASLNALAAPLALPFEVYRWFWPPQYGSPGRAPIEYTIIFVVTFVGTNILIYYIPVRLFLKWQERRINLP